MTDDIRFKRPMDADFARTAIMHLAHGVLNVKTVAILHEDVVKIPEPVREKLSEAFRALMDAREMLDALDEKAKSRESASHA